MIQYFKIPVSLIFSVFILTGSAARDTNSTKPLPPLTGYFTAGAFCHTDSVELTFPDTALSRFYSYNPVFNSGYLKFLGNTGTAHQRLPFAPDSLEFFRYTDDRLSLYKSDHNRSVYYDTRKPYTGIFYANGSKREEMLQVVHSQNIKEVFNFGVRYSKSSSDGFYSHQHTDLLSVSGYNRYKSRNNRYGILGSYSYNNLKAEENGGIDDDTLFELSAGIDMQTVTTNLTNGFSWEKSRNIFIAQYLNFGKRVSPSDSLPDSLRTYYIRPSFRIVQSANFKEWRHSYSDISPNDDFYAGFFYPSDSIDVFDSSRTKQLTNSIDIHFFGKRINGIPAVTAGAGITHQSFSVWQNSFDTMLTGLWLRAYLKFNPVKPLSAILSAQYAAGGNNRQDYSVNGGLFYKIKKWNSTALLHADVTAREPGFSEVYFVNPNISWQNGFGKTQTETGWLAVSSDGLNLSGKAGATAISNQVYYSSFDARPQQLGESITIFFCSVTKNFTLGKWSIYNTILWQELSGTDIIRFPGWILKHNLFYENTFFKNALRFRWGADLLWYSEYSADAYMPFTGRFYLQNQTLIGGYPYIDLYTAMKIKSVRFFIKFEHVNAGFSGNRYYVTPHYPSPGRAFKVGIDWRMYE